jgi:hypothetical protein
MALSAAPTNCSHRHMQAQSQMHHLRRRSREPAVVATVTFRLPAWVGARHAELAAEFASWAPMAMDRAVDGSFELTLGVEPGRWGYYFLIDGGRAVADPDAEEYSEHEIGPVVSVLHVPAQVPGQDRARRDMVSQRHPALGP